MWVPQEVRASQTCRVVSRIGAQELNCIGVTGGGAKHPEEATGIESTVSVGPPPIPNAAGRPRRSKTGTGPPPIPKRKGSGGGVEMSAKSQRDKQEDARVEAARAKLAEEEAAKAKLAEEEEEAQLRYLAEQEEEEAQLRFLAEQEAAAALEEEEEAARLAQEKAAATAAAEAQAKADQERLAAEAEAEAEAARLAKAQELAREREEAETISALKEEMRRLCTEGSIDDLNDIVAAADEFSEHVPIEMEQVQRQTLHTCSYI